MKQLLLNGQLSIDKAYKQIMGFNYSIDNDKPFSDEEVKLLNEIETSAARIILCTQSKNTFKAQKANINLQKSKDDIKSLASNNLKENGNKKHFNLIMEEIDARINFGTNFGILHESEAGEYVRDENKYKPLGNKSIFLTKNTTATIKDYQNLIISIRISESIDIVRSLIDDFEQKYNK